MAFDYVMKLCSFILSLVVSLVSTPLLSGNQAHDASNTTQIAAETGTAQSAFTQETKPGISLGNSVEGVLSKNHLNRYQISMASGQYMRLSVIARGTGVTAALLNSSGTPIFERVIRKRKGITSVHFIAPESGLYGIEIRAKEGPPSANYQLRIDE